MIDSIIALIAGAIALAPIAIVLGVRLVAKWEGAKNE
jgi:hypothetical protein